MWDVFISHASEDKATIVRPLAAELEALGLSVDKALEVASIAFGKKREIGYEQLAVPKFVDNAMKSLGWQ